MSWLRGVLKRQYRRTMREAYAFARTAAGAATGDVVLDCGSGAGYERMASFGGRGPALEYLGLEWSHAEVETGRARGLDLIESDLNRSLPVESDSCDCVIAYSVLEHLLKPCAFLRECQRILRVGGTLVVLTPNISTWFAVLQLAAGRMPSSGPHPDSNELLALEQDANLEGRERDDVSADTPMHRHLVVFSFKVLRRYLQLIGFEIIAARGFGYYPLPRWLQPVFEWLDPGHCHQMVFVCKKRSAFPSIKTGFAASSIDQIRP